MARVLVVDDERSIRLTLREFLQSEGYAVEVAEDANRALALLTPGAFDVVVTDIVLPGLSGMELLKAARRAAPEVQVIMMTGEPTVETAAEAVRMGASDYLSKPVTKNAIMRSVASAVLIKTVDEERRREQKAKERYQQELQEAVSRLSAANEQLRQAAAFREEVEQVARHDLKSPLNIIILAPELIRMMGGSLTDKQRECLGMIENAGRRLLDMINLSLDLFKMEQGMYTLRPEPVDLLRVTQEAINHHSALMQVRGLSTVVLVDGRPTTESDACVVPGERLLCYSMIGNLLKNALEASPEGGTVTVRFERGDATCLSIRNPGVVPESVRGRFFEKFATSGKEHGTGLGAYSARLIAELHGARIAVDTSVPDCTTVSVSFPGTPAAAPRPA